MKKECWCETHKSECEINWKECFLTWFEWYLSCINCSHQPNSETDDLCKCDFKEHLT